MLPQRKQAVFHKHKQGFPISLLNSQSVDLSIVTQLQHGTEARIFRTLQNGKHITKSKCKTQSGPGMGDGLDAVRCRRAVVGHRAVHRILTVRSDDFIKRSKSKERRMREGMRIMAGKF
jgi:hypothetical protein